MIYTLTCNPALDWMMLVDSLEEGKTNRATSEALFLGGKGINVSHMLQNLGTKTCAWGFLAGATGAAISALLREAQIPSDFITLLHENTRINVKVKRMEGKQCVSETEINGRGPHVSAEDISRLKTQVEGLSKKDTLVLSGSLAPGCPASLYQELAEIAASREAKVVVDTTGSALSLALAANPFLIKPNNEELAELFGISKDDTCALHASAIKLAEKTHGFVLVSCGKEGAFLAGSRGILGTSRAPSGVLVNSVGAGDSMVAGFIAGYVRTKDPLEALALATAAGSASAFTQGIATKEAVLDLVKHVEIRC